jgi:hypothetical protein
MKKQFQFKITDPRLHEAPMAFPDEEARDGMLAYLEAEYGVALDDIAQIIFTSVDEDGTVTIDKALQHGEDVTKRAKFA